MLLAGCAKTPHTVRYEVGGTAGTLALTYRNATGGTEQRDVAPPWSAEFQTQGVTPVSITAFNKTREGRVTCRVLVDGKVIQEATSEGGFKLVRCNGLAGVLKAPTPTPAP
jgi:hypothetical protein